MTTSLACADAELNGADVHIRCLDPACPSDVPDYYGSFPLTENYSFWATVHARHPVDITVGEHHLPSVVLPTAGLG